MIAILVVSAEGGEGGGTSNDNNNSMVLYLFFFHARLLKGFAKNFYNELLKHRERESQLKVDV